jgi:hypothetical protein
MLELNPVGRMPVLSVYHPAATSVSRLPEGVGDLPAYQALGGADWAT